MELSSWVLSWLEGLRGPPWCNQKLLPLWAGDFWWCSNKVTWLHMAWGGGGGGGRHRPHVSNCSTTCSPHADSVELSILWGSWLLNQTSSLTKQCSLCLSTILFYELRFAFLSSNCLEFITVCRETDKLIKDYPLYFIVPLIVSWQYMFIGWAEIKIELLYLYALF